LVGTALVNRLGKRAFGTCNLHPRPGLIKLDIGDRAAVDRVVARCKPRVIVHAAAYADVNGCELDPQRSHWVNVEGTRNVVRAAATASSRYVFLSTDYVFGGEVGPHRLGETIAPLNVYGRHKAEAEALVASVLDDYLILRACSLYGYQPGGKNFVQAVYELGRAGSPMRVPVDQWGSPTYADDIAAAVDAATTASLRGIAHIAGPDYIDRLELARRAAEVFSLEPGFIQGVSTAELGQAASRPLRAGLDAGDSPKRLGVRFRGLDEGLACMRARIGQSQSL